MADLKISDGQIQALRAIRAGKPVSAIMRETLIGLKLITASNNRNIIALTSAGLAAIERQPRKTRLSVALAGRPVRAAGRRETHDRG